MSGAKVIVTGASRGIGAAIAVELKQRGYAVTGLLRSSESAVGTDIACDLTNEAEVCKTFSAIAAEGAIAGLVNNAGIHPEKDSKRRPRIHTYIHPGSRPWGHCRYI